MAEIVHSLQKIGKKLTNSHIKTYNRAAILIPDGKKASFL